MRRRALNKWQYNVKMETSANSTTVPYTVKLLYNHPKSSGSKSVELQGNNDYTFQNVPQGTQTVQVSGTGVYNKSGSVLVNEENKQIRISVSIGTAGFYIAIHPAEKQEYNQSTGVTNTTYLPTYATIRFTDSSGAEKEVRTNTSTGSTSYSNEALVNSTVVVVVHDTTYGGGVYYSRRIEENSTSMSVKGETYSFTVS